MNTMQITFTLCILSACLTIALSGTHPDGVSKVSREQDALGNYKFSYAVSNPEGEHFREEGTDHLGRVIGSYGLTHLDGTQRVVDYVADKDGFRAEVRSNEPGVASSESADASVVKLQPGHSLAVAATSIENSGAAFGTRLRSDTSRVSYANQEEDNISQQERLDNSAKEQRNYEDYRPRNPVAYYPSGAVDTARPLRPPAYASDIPARTLPQHPSSEVRPLDTYLPPIDPQSAVRRTPYLRPRERTSDQSPYTTTSRRPYIPPYGGFDDDPEPVERPVDRPVERRPEISMSTIHGGLGRDDFDPPRVSTPAYGAGRYPSDDESFHRDYIDRHFPPRSNYPPIPRLPGSVLSTPPRSVPGPIFGPPSYETGLRPPNFALRAVPIPNGIQAVRVDPETGRVYERLVYPLYLRDGQTVYDRNILLHNDDVSDDSVVRNRDPGYLDIPFRNRPPFRYIRNPSFGADEEFVNLTRRYNRTLDPLALSIPTARDLELVHRQLAQVEGFDRTHFPNPSFFRNVQYRNNEYPLFNDFDDAANENPDAEDRPYSRSRSAEHSRSAFSRDPRLIDRLTPEDTKEIVVSKSESLIDDAKSAATNPKPSVAEKE